MAEAMAEGSDPQVPCAQPSSLPLESRPTCVICLGMAGSGKTTFVGVGTLEINCVLVVMCVCVCVCVEDNGSFACQEDAPICGEP